MHTFRTFRILNMPGCELEQDLVLTNHHGIADGTANCLTYDLLLRNLDDLLAGRSLDESQKIEDFEVKEIEGL